MSFSAPDVGIQRVAAHISLTFVGNDVIAMNVPSNIGSLITQTGPITANDQNNDGFIQRGETVDHTNVDIPFVDPIPDLSDATVVGVGLMGGLLSGILVQYPVILVFSGGSQFLLYPQGVLGLITTATGALNTPITFFPNGQIGPGGGVRPCFARQPDLPGPRRRRDRDAARGRPDPHRRQRPAAAALDRIVPAVHGGSCAQPGDAPDPHWPGGARHGQPRIGPAGLSAAPQPGAQPHRQEDVRHGRGAEPVPAAARPRSCARTRARAGIGAHRTQAGPSPCPGRPTSADVLTALRRHRDTPPGRNRAGLGR